MKNKKRPENNSIQSIKSCKWKANKGHKTDKMIHSQRPQWQYDEFLQLHQGDKKARDSVLNYRGLCLAGTHESFVLRAKLCQVLVDSGLEKPSVENKQITQDAQSSLCQNNTANKI